MAARRVFPSFLHKVKSFSQHTRIPSVQLHRKKVPENRAVDIPLDGGHPVDLEDAGIDPTRVLKFLPVDGDGVLGTVADVREEVDLGLTAKAFFAEALPELITVRPAGRDDAVVRRPEGDFLADLTCQRGLVGLLRAASTLRELPGTAVIGALADEHAPVGTTKDEGHVSPVIHLANLNENLAAANWKLASTVEGTMNQGMSTVRTACLAALVGVATLTAQTPTPSPTPETGGAFWRAELPGGTYMVALPAIASISSHEYLVDGASRVTEVTVDTLGSVQARFYFIEPNIPQAPGGIGQSALNFAQEKAAEALERSGTDVWKKVVKKYPEATHAHTVEYRLDSKEALASLFRSLESSWREGRGRTFKP